MAPHNLRYAKDDPDGVDRWKRRTEPHVQKAIHDVFHGHGSDAQKRMVDHWSDRIVREGLGLPVPEYHDLHPRHLRLVESDGEKETEGE
jgi:hypothetical protein